MARAMETSIGESPRLKILPVDISRSGHSHSLWDFGRALNQRVAQEAAAGERRVLLGYSLGGRLALHTLLDAAFIHPGLWDAAVIVSAHPGLSVGSANERSLRIAADERWAERFERDPWPRLVNDWGAQPVFCGKPWPLARHERDFDRDELRSALSSWSLGGRRRCRARSKSSGSHSFGSRAKRILVLPGSRGRWGTPALSGSTGSRPAPGTEFLREALGFFVRGLFLFFEWFVRGLY